MPISYPYGFSCWYGYDKDCSSLTSFTSSSSSSLFNVCSQSLNQTYYHDGSSSYPVSGDKVYSSSSGGSGNYLSAGYYLLGPIGDEYMQVGSAGTVSSVDICFGGP